MGRTKVTILTLLEKKRKGEPITMLTAYDYPLASLEEESEIDIILVGDSLGMTVLGYDSTLPVTMDVMIPHTTGVRRGAPTAFVIGDMPYMSYQISIEEAIRNAGRFMSEGGVDAIKLEGGRNVAKTVEALVKATIPVMGHLGITPQSVAQMGGFKAQGRDAASAYTIIEDACILEEAGICLLLLEGIPPEVAKIVTERSSVPVISIGAGPHCDGQLLIVNDLLGFFGQYVPRFVKKYVDLNQIISEALCAYKQEVETKKFPEPKHTYSMMAGEQEKLRAILNSKRM